MIENITSIGLIVFFIIAGTTAILNKNLPVWFCINMHWHLKPLEKGHDGCSASGTCPRCGKEVLQDSQGNWF